MRSAVPFALTHYWSSTEINDYVAHLASHYGDLCSIEIVSNSGEGRLIRALKISLHGRGHIDGSRPIVVVDAGIHAREWIAPMTAVYFMQQLVENSAYYADILNRVDIVIIPQINPDGYEFSRTSVNGEKLIYFVFFKWKMFIF